jgi:hypothetical protein
MPKQDTNYVEAHNPKGGIVKLQKREYHSYYGFIYQPLERGSREIPSSFIVGIDRKLHATSIYSLPRRGVLHTGVNPRRSDPSLGDQENME